MIYDITGFDASTLAESLSTPGIDPRSWNSYGIVDADTDDAHSVLFEDDDGSDLPYPMVNVTLQPSGISLPCRVLAPMAGNGEGCWEPIGPGDEVLVEIVGGDERAGGVILGRLNQGRDLWPSTVAGQDAKKNTFGFRRMRTPYIIEAKSLAFRAVETGANLSIDDTGQVFLTDGDKNLLALTHAAISLQSKDALANIQIPSDTHAIAMQTKSMSFVLDEADVQLQTNGTVHFTTAGAPAADHVATVEGLANLFLAFLAAAGAAASTPTSLVAFFNTFNGGPSSAAVPLAALITSTAALPAMPPITAAITTVLSTPKVPGVNSGIGCAGFIVG